MSLDNLVIICKFSLIILWETEVEAEIIFLASFSFCQVRYFFPADLDSFMFARNFCGKQRGNLGRFYLHLSFWITSQWIWWAFVEYISTLPFQLNPKDPLRLYCCSYSCLLTINHLEIAVSSKASYELHLKFDAKLIQFKILLYILDLVIEYNKPKLCVIVCLFMTSLDNSSWLWF